MISVEETLEIAGRHHKAGKLPQAEKLYRQVLEREPQNPDAIHALGAMALQQGSVDKALELFGLASSLRPDDPAILGSLGLAYRHADKLDEARVCLERAATLSPGRAEPLNNLADLHLALGDPRRAAELLQSAIELDPEYHQAYFNLGNVHTELGDLDRAIRLYEKALELSPDDWQTLTNLGLTYKRAGALERAEERLGRAALLDPGNAVIAINQSSLMIETGRFAKAEKLCREASAQIPSNPIPHNLLGLALRGQGKLPEAVLSFVKSLSLNKQAPDVHLNLGDTLRREGKLDKAVGCYDRALEIAPEFAPATYARACVELLRGDMERGWVGFAERRKIPFFAKRVADFDLPRWDGESLEGKSILLYPEGETRETLVLLRFIEKVREAGAAKIAVGCPPALARLCDGIEAVDELHLPGNPVPEVDLFASLDDAARFLCPTVDSIPTSPYLRVDEDLARRWKERFTDVSEKKIGFLWRGDGDPTDPYTHVDIEEFSRLFDAENTRWYSLQYATPDEDRERLATFDNVEDLSVDVKGLADALACISSLDLLISPDNLALHLAGGAGIEAWALVSNSPEWWWGADGNKSYWYPTLQRFERPGADLWTGLVEWLHLR